MTPTVIISGDAERDLDAIYRYVEARSGPARADSFVSEIVAFCQRLRTFPERGTRRDDIRPGLRLIGYRRRVAVAFRVEPNLVTILGVYYGGRDYESELGEGS